MKRNLKFWILIVAVALLCAACSTDNSSGQGQQGDTTKPPPQVRVEALPSATALPPLLTDIVTPTIEPTAAQVYVAPPPPDEDALANQISAMMDEIDRKLKSQDLLLKP